MITRCAHEWTPTKDSYWREVCESCWTYRSTSGQILQNNDDGVLILVHTDGSEHAIQVASTWIITVSEHLVDPRGLGSPVSQPTLDDERSRYEDCPDCGHPWREHHRGHLTCTADWPHCSCDGDQTGNAVLVRSE